MVYLHIFTSDIYIPVDIFGMSNPHGQKKAGSTLCICGTSYKNNAVPPTCTSEGCGFQLGKEDLEDITC